MSNRVDAMEAWDEEVTDCDPRRARAFWSERSMTLNGGGELRLLVASRRLLHLFLSRAGRA